MGNIDVGGPVLIKSISVLVVDDEVECASATLRWLKREPRITLRAMATSAEVAMGMIAEGFRPDVIVTDFHMAGMSGGDLVRELRRRGITIPVILLSAEVQVAELQGDEDFAAFIRKGETHGAAMLAAVREELQLLGP